MTQEKQQAWWDSPKFTIDCVLANAHRQLEADGCVLERVEGGCKLTTPGHLKTGDFVKVQLWLEGEDTFVDIRLAEVRRIHEHWVSVEMIQITPNDRMRLKQYIDPPADKHTKELAPLDHLLIRA